MRGVFYVYSNLNHSGDQQKARSVMSRTFTFRPWFSWVLETWKMIGFICFQGSGKSRNLSISKCKTSFKSICRTLQIEKQCLRSNLFRKPSMTLCHKWYRYLEYGSDVGRCYWKIHLDPGKVLVYLLYETGSMGTTLILTLSVPWSPYGTTL
jgi:hypothetical protein